MTVAQTYAARVLFAVVLVGVFSGLKGWVEVETAYWIVAIMFTLSIINELEVHLE